MFDYQIIKVGRCDGTKRTERAVEVFNCTTGRTVSITRSRPFEKREAWIERAFEAAQQAVA